jgi:hypothetical protein
MTGLSNQIKANALAAIVEDAAKLQIFTDAYGTLLAEFTLSVPAFGAPTVASPSVATGASMPKTTTGAATGTAGSYRVVNASNVMLWEGTGSTAVNTSAAQVILTNLSISTGQTVNLVSMTMSFAGTITA